MGRRSTQHAPRIQRGRLNLPTSPAPRVTLPTQSRTDPAWPCRRHAHGPANTALDLLRGNLQTRKHCGQHTSQASPTNHAFSHSFSPALSESFPDTGTHSPSPNVQGYAKISPRTKCRVYRGAD